MHFGKVRRLLYNVMHLAETYRESHSSAKFRFSLETLAFTFDGPTLQALLKKEPHVLVTCADGRTTFIHSSRLPWPILPSQCLWHLLDFPQLWEVSAESHSIGG